MLGPADTEAFPALERVSRHIAAADRLIQSAADALITFYVDRNAPPGATGFRGFMRDTLEDPSQTLFSTGGAGVVAGLWQLEPHLPYLCNAVSSNSLSLLRMRRDTASKWLSDPQTTLTLSGKFGSLNALTASHIAYQTAHAPISDRALVFGAIVLAQYLEGWPRLANVENRHPFVAACLLRAASHLCNSDILKAIATLDENVAISNANIAFQENPKESMELLKETIASVKTSLPIGKDAARLADARRTYRDMATNYLWQQHGFSSVGSSSAPNSLSYDPVGTCFAIDILVSSINSDSSDVEFTRRLAEYADLIHHSIRHVIKGLTPTGSLAYGLPFSYDPKGMGAFATSISGLSALVRVIGSIFQHSRQGFYSNANFLDDLLTTNSELFERLFGLSTTIEGAKRDLEIEHLSDRHVKGWSTDRAASFTRIESWVTADVLLFGAYVRIALQEMAQFRVLQKYGGIEVPDDCPEWPYDSPATPPQRATRPMRDPDESAKPNPVDDFLAPARVLHKKICEPLLRNTQLWKLEVSAVLLFGPPGTAKSTLAQSLAKRLRWHFVELTPSNFVEHGLEMIERRAKEIFEELGILRETVVLFDELDSLLTDRELLDRSSILNFSVPAMLPKLQRLSKLAKKQRLLIVFATNFYDRLDPAMVRRGRVDERLIVLPHTSTARKRVLNDLLSEGNPEKGGVAFDEAERGAEKTALGVYEDLKRYASAVKTGESLIGPTVGIAPALYFSRIPPKERRVIAVRSTERLAIEVCEVVGRLLDEPRDMSADAGRQKIIERLEALEKLLKNQKDTSIPERDTWIALCVAVRNALRAEAS